MERVKGIEPSSVAWKAKVLPLNYTRVTQLLYKIIGKPSMVPEAGLEPAQPTAGGF